jgi:hypothetical protein
MVRVCPRGVMRLICCDVNFGNVCSVLDLVNGSPLEILLLLLEFVILIYVILEYKKSIDLLC